jgi:hypothetical protein
MAKETPVSLSLTEAQLRAVEKALGSTINAYRNSEVTPPVEMCAAYLHVHTALSTAVEVA